jgi:hypothetical protein
MSSEFDVLADTKLVLLVSWEMNGYDDSDGYTLFWDVNRNDFRKELMWTTRFADRVSKWEPTMLSTPEELAPHVSNITSAITDRMANALVYRNNARIDDPHAEVCVGKPVILKKSTVRTIRQVTESECKRCSGTGKYSTPRGNEYNCGSCNGAGHFVSYYSNTKQKTKLAEGELFDCLKCEIDQYASNYRGVEHNLIVSNDKGTFIIPSEFFKLGESYMTYDEAKAIVLEQSSTTNFADELGRMHGMRAWSDNIIDTRVLYSLAQIPTAV